MDKENMVYLHKAVKKDEIIPFAGKWMELESIMLSKISQTQKDKYHMFSLICKIKTTKKGMA
jgi:hypothetical protein